MKISEMTLEELQDYAMQQEERITGLESENNQLRTEKSELSGLNLSLQRRNNDLFMRVEQSGNITPTAEPQPQTTENCEDFAKRFVEGGIL